MKIIKVESCFMCPLSDSQNLRGKVLVLCAHEKHIDEYGSGTFTDMGTEGIWDKCPLEDYEDNKNK